MQMKFFLFLFFSLVVYLVAGGLFYGVVANEINLTNRTIWITGYGFLFEIFILSCIHTIIYVLFKRKRLSLILTLLIYLMFLTVNVFKIKNLGTPLFPNDFILIGDLIRTWHVFIIYVPFIVLFGLFMAWIIFHDLKKVKADKFKAIPILTAIVLIAYYGIVIQNENIRLALRAHNIFHKKNMDLTKRSLANGFMSSFIQVLLFTGKPNSQSDYSKNKIAQIISKYDLSTPTGGENSVDNVIVLMVEAFTDPKQFSWNYSKQVLPHFNYMRLNNISGTAISPVFGGKSINAEFELMTGMSNRFTPIESTPYQEFVDHNIPSLARSFNHNGYTSNAVLMVHFGGFGYGKIYDFLGVDQKISISPNIPETKHDPTGKSVDSHVVAQQILTLIEEQQKSFIFAFPNSSHFPWKMADYPNIDLHLLNADITNKEKETLLAYTHAINHVDELFGLLLEVLEKSEENNLILIVGDHQPSLDFFHNNLAKNNTDEHYIEIIKKKYSTPYVLWTNHNLNHQSESHISMNLIPALVAKEAGIPVKGFIKFIVLLEEKFDVISHVFKLKNKDYAENISSSEKEMIDDYETLQYDLLFGNNYLSELL